MRNRQILNGLWDYRIGQGKFTKRTVPYSDLPVGESECALCFDICEDISSRRAFLVFDGITYSADVYLNDTFLGKMYPYSEYKFDVGQILNKTGNRLSVKIYDCDVAFGPSEGWENYSGIIRDVYIEYTENCIADEIIWHTEFSPDFSLAKCFVDYTIDNQDENTSFTVVLKDKLGNVVAKTSGEGGSAVFEVVRPYLWSPDFPYLYTLECSVIQSGKVCDFVTQKVGFKELVTKGKRFYLNGEPFFLLGVNRHDMYGNHGHTLTEEEMYKDMRMIKDAGVNYVRLVHYPHHKRIIEIADEIGLLVSEEPGLWWSDMKNQEICDGALEVLRRLIKRDRNHASIAFWLSFNECIFTLDFLKESAKVSRECDKYHMVSGANCMSIEMTKENYPICGFDFYSMHPYAPSTERLLESAKELHEMPLLLTEWGGYYCYNNPNLFAEFIDTIIDCWNNPDDEPVIAGAVYWAWAEMYEFSRGKPACNRGVLSEGLVDIYRNPNPDLEIFRKGFAKLYQPKTEPTYEISFEHEVTDDADFIPVDVSALSADKDGGWDKMISDSKVPIARYCYPNKANRKMDNGPKLPCSVHYIGCMPLNLSEIPYVVTDELVVGVNSSASKIHVIGNTSMPKGFPIEGAYGEDVCEYIIEYADGTSDSHIMKNGVDITTSTAQHGPSRINPVAENSPRIIKFNYDYDYEHYVINVRAIETDSAKEIRNLKIKNLQNGYNPLFYGLTLEM